MPRPELIETFENPYADRDYEIHMDCSEFTSLCPLGGIETDAEELALLKGGAPDFGIIRSRVSSSIYGATGTTEFSTSGQSTEFWMTLSRPALRSG